MGNEIVDALYENDRWRELLKTSIAEAEALIAQDAIEHGDRKPTE